MDKRQAGVFCLLAAIILGLTGFIIFRETKDKGQVVRLEDGYMYQDGTYWDADEKEEEVKEKQKQPERIKVYIAGQVQSPGVIEVLEGSRLADVIELAGGFLEEADLLQVNLAVKVQDEGMYIIPKEGQILDHVNHAYQGNREAKGKVNINMAEKSLLETLPRIGPVLADRIIEHREKNGPFQTIEDIKNVSGIGDKTFDGLKELITIK